MIWQFNPNHPEIGPALICGPCIIAIKAAPAAQTLSFTKKDGTKTVRIVATNWFDFQPPVGGKSNVQPGQILFADLCKVAIGESRVIISTYTQNIIALA